MLYYIARYCRPMLAQNTLTQMVQRCIIVAQNTLTQMVQRHMRAMDATMLEVESEGGDYGSLRRAVNKTEMAGS